MIPNKIFFTKGVGRHRNQLSSFELALRDARIAQYNLVYVSSIFPPNCKRIPVDDGLKFLNPGEIVYCVMARNQTDEHNRLIAASIGVALPSDKNIHGYLSEHHPFGETDEVAGDFAEDLAAEMLATTLGLDMPDQNLHWDEKEKHYKMSGKIVTTLNYTQSAEGKKDYWTTVISAAVLLNGLEGKIISP